MSRRIGNLSWNQPGVGDVVGVYACFALSHPMHTHTHRDTHLCVCVCVRMFVCVFVSIAISKLTGGKRALCCTGREFSMRSRSRQASARTRLFPSSFPGFVNWHLSPRPYLDARHLLEIAIQEGCQAVHPGGTLRWGVSRAELGDSWAFGQSPDGFRTQAGFGSRLLSSLLRFLNG